MLKRKTVFIIGAGASTEVGLPMGSTLIQMIEDCINVQYEFGRQIVSGDTRFAAALSAATTKPDGDVGNYNDHLKACHRLRAGLKQEPLSIDTYLDTHSHDEKMVLAGKLAIATCILSSEAHSRLHVDTDQRTPKIDFSTLKNSWYPLIQEILFTGVKKSDLKNIFKDVIFITFNYDRCIEHFFYNAVKDYFHTTPEETIDCLSVMEVHHVYGAIAPLDWQTDIGAIAFGQMPSIAGLTSAAQRIRLFTEKFDQKESLERLRAALKKAQNIVFLGFSFQEQNIELLACNNKTADLRIFGTAYGISEIDRQTISKRIAEAFGAKAPLSNIVLDTRWKCRDLFEQLHHTLRSA
jgi:hypothetical protein